MVPAISFRLSGNRMACPGILTGTRFLGTALGAIDCHAQTIGAYGYGALADPGSSVSLALAGLLTIFIAIFGIRLLLGYPVAGRDVVSDVVRIGIVLTLATSWPAWRVLGYDVVMNGPADMARTIGLASGLPGSDNAVISRLQNADDGLVAITMYGTGRLTGGVVGGSDLGDSFHGVAMSDETGLGWGRVVFLAGTIGPFAVLRLGAGILLAIAPLMAGFMLFGAGMGIFAGWLRGLTFCALGSLAFTLIQGVELAILDPWISDVLAQRNSGSFTPSAPTEIMVLALAFTILAFGTQLLIGRVAFQPHLAISRLMHSGANTGPSFGRQPVSDGRPMRLGLDTHSRAHGIADAVSSSMRREGAGNALVTSMLGSPQDAARRTPEQLRGISETASPDMLGSSFRRTRIRASAANTTRDRQMGSQKP